MRGINATPAVTGALNRCQGGGGGQNPQDTLRYRRKGMYCKEKKILSSAEKIERRIKILGELNDQREDMVLRKDAEGLRELAERYRKINAPRIAERIIRLAERL